LRALTRTDDVPVGRAYPVPGVTSAPQQGLPPAQTLPTSAVILVFGVLNDWRGRGPAGGHHLPWRGRAERYRQAREAAMVF